MIRLDRFDKESVNHSTNRTVSGYKDSILGIIPDDWEVRKLKEVSERVQRRNDCKPYEVLTISSIGGFLNQTERFSKVIAGKNIAKYILLKKNEFAYNKGNSKTYPFGCIFRLEDYEKALVPNVYYCFEIVNGISEFYKHYFIAGKLNRQLSRLINTGVRNDGLLNINVGDFFDVYVPVPPLEEQQKIASILSTWDKAIELKEKLIEQKKELKKGLMQKLLTGEVRLPGYKYSWKVYTIEQLAEFFTDGDWIEAPYITEDGVLLIQTGNIGIGEYIEKNNMKFISEKSFIELNCTEVKPGDILICRLADPIGRSCIVPNTGMKMITAVDVAIFRVNNNLAVTEFINYKLNLPKTLRKMDSLGAGSTRKRISRKNLGKVKLTIPDLEEQKAIVDILLQIDKNIVLLEKELGELKKQKKGLMQLLLTGKVRVKV